MKKIVLLLVSALITLSMNVLAAETNAQNIQFMGLVAGQDLIKGQDTTITVTAPNESEIVKIDLYYDGQYIGTKRQSPYEFDISQINIGTYTFKAIAQDTSNQGSYASMVLKVSQYELKQAFFNNFDTDTPGSSPNGFFHDTGMVPKGGYADSRKIGSNTTQAYEIGVRAGSTVNANDPPFSTYNFPNAHRGYFVVDTKMCISNTEGTAFWVFRQGWLRNIDFTGGRIILSRHTGGQYVIDNAYSAGEWFRLRLEVHLEKPDPTYDLYINDQLKAENIVFAAIPNLATEPINSIRLSLLPPASGDAFFMAYDDFTIYMNNETPSVSSAEFHSGTGPSTDRNNVPVDTNKILATLSSTLSGASVNAAKVKILGGTDAITVTRAAFDESTSIMTIEFNSALKHSTDYSLVLLPTLELLDGTPYGLETTYKFRTETSEYDASDMMLIVNGVEQGYKSLSTNDQVAARVKVHNKTDQPKEATLLMVVRSEGRFLGITSKSATITAPVQEIETEALPAIGESLGVEVYLIRGWNDKRPFSNQYIKF